MTTTTAPHAPEPRATPPLDAPPPVAPLAWLLPMPRTTPDGVRLAEVGAIGWQVLVRDGVLRPVWGDVAAVAGRPPGPALRAAAVRPLVPPRAVLGRAGAVWVHTAGPAPARFDVLVPPRVRRPSPHPSRVPHECPLPPADVVDLGEVRVTTVLRTALDLVRWLEPGSAAPLLRRLRDHAGLAVDAVVAAAERTADRRLPDRLRDVLAADAAPDRVDPLGVGQDGVAPDFLAGTPAALEPVIR